MKVRAKLERELDKISTVMEGLNKQGAKLQQVINSLGSDTKGKLESNQISCQLNITRQILEWVIGHNLCQIYPINLQLRT